MSVRTLTFDEISERAEQVMRENGFEPEFPPEVRAEVDGLRERGAGEGGPSVRDLRGLLWSSIDNRSSRDLDQVEYAERLDDGDIRVLIGIADVDPYVRQGSAIDRHAAHNTVSVYTEARTFPLLPEELSFDLTSLVEDADRLCVVVELVIKENGDVPGNDVFLAWTRNRAKLNYSEIGEWLEGDAPLPDKVKGIDGLERQLRLQAEAAGRLHRYRCERGALEFESIESSAIVVGGEIRGLETVKTNSARRIIENFMIAANVEMAEFLERNNSFSLRRVVKTPERWDGIRKIAAEYDEPLPAEPDAIALSAFLDRRREADPLHFPDLSLSIVKLIGSGDYVVKRPGVGSDGHFGLAVRDYAHSTAPNRRYSDIIVQRLVKAALRGDGEPYTFEELNAIAERCNLQESAARKVERKIRKVVAANVMRRHIGESFKAIVTGVTKSGTFARILRPPVDGRVVRGERGLEVGEAVTVTLLSADPRTGFIDFAADRARRSTTAS
ncbi:MAG: RNB domain-containing ribonuclease [Pyrinomonadaceae bacterium]